MDKTKIKEVTSSAKGLASGFTRKTYVVHAETANKIDAISFWDGTSLKDMMFEMQSNFVKAWEKKNGEVKMPKKK